MANLAKQKRIAADVMKVGEGKVWIDPDPEATANVAITAIESMKEKGRRG